jgi:PilZ domain
MTRAMTTAMTSSPAARHLARVEDRAQRHRLRLRVTTSRGSSFTVNVSHGGACTEQLRVFAVGSRIEGHISLDGRDVSFAGTVTWTMAGDSRLNHLGRMGVRFERIGSELAEGLAARTARLAPRAPRACLVHGGGSSVSSTPRKEFR